MKYQNQPFSLYIKLSGDNHNTLKNFVALPNGLCNFEVDEYEDEVDEYEDEVNRLIRLKYSLSDELAILRQRDTKPDEFKAYNDYVEECKATAKEKLKKYEEWRNS